MAETKKATPEEQPQDDADTNSTGPIITHNVMELLENVPTEMKQRDQWVLWRLQRRDGKLTKVPFMANRKPADTTDPETWTSFQDALDAYKRFDRYFKGIGYVFSPDDPYTGIDLDKCIEDDEINDAATVIIEELNSYTERSQSKTGIHVIIKGKIPGDRRRTGSTEMYDSGRFFAMTGDRVSHTPHSIEDRQPELNAIYERTFNKPREPKPKVSTAYLGTVLDDQDILSIAMKAANGTKFATLFSGDWTSLHGSQSQADIALCNLLAFYTKDAAQIDRLFRGSGLMRPKWDREDYSRRTIEDALSMVQEQYKGRGQNSASETNKLNSGKVIRHPAADRAIRGGKPNFNNTDLGNAKRLVHYFGEDLRYCYAFGSWYIWDGKRWRKDEIGGIEMKAKETVRQIYKEAFAEEADEKRVALMKHGTKSESGQSLSNMIKWARSEVPVTPDQLDADQWKLNCANGVIDLKTGQLSPHSRDDMMTHLIATKYDPAAECPTWLNFVNRIMQDEQGQVRTELVDFLHKAVGYSLTGDTSEQVMFVLHGTGKNGKSTFINTITEMLGEYSRQANTETFVMKKQAGINSDIARLKGSRLVSAVESEQGKRLAESLVKQLTGGERITARFLYGDDFEFKPSFKIFFTTNHKPEIRGTDKGIWRRIRLIPFTVFIPPEERDLKMDEKLLTELPGILRWAVEGCLKWQKEGLGEPKAVMQATEEYREEMDILFQFVNDCCVIHSKAKVASAKLYNAYTNWCDEFGEHAIKERKFREQLKESYGIQPTRLSDKSGSRGWEGIGLRDETNISLSDTSDVKNGIVQDINDYRKNDVRNVKNDQNRVIEEGEL